ncbi:hypothetical protein FUT79_08640 [Treponema phagedenis]|uniref:Uncharacterized protein n=1 Tax=Treponema phagedenis TaxID=162 RepID=A0AAE6IU94_TREPH|nr:hypothetical protein FUT79_08640 [Treponema phagedenis]QEJ98362.1 hypothetical protein FUT82_10380 [Treponema phagedenis]QEK03872.1 hypothetical protein FUT83_08690 [Treponema phagedenis]QEK06121.1 hypothetical protein FUT80_05000 [Treponema phagedenis]QEK09487.1 hypothetical protein FUT81_08605 [Treponema phagedenis]
MVNCSPLSNSKRCLKASIVNYKIEALKLVGFILPRTAKLRTGTDARGSKQKRRFKARLFTKL